jgi:hypothetical protein
MRNNFNLTGLRTEEEGDLLMVEWALGSEDRRRAAVHLQPAMMKNVCVPAVSTYV